MLLTTLLAALHIFCAMGWLGGGFLFGFVVGPRLTRMPPAATREFFVTVVPGVVRFFQAMAGATILFGVLLLYNLTNGDASLFSFSTAWGRAIDLGMATALVAFLASEFGAAPGFQRLVRLFAAIPTTPGASPPADLASAAKRAQGWAIFTTVFLLLTLGFMSAAGFY